MIISQKCQYALRAVYELAKHKKRQLKIAEIAAAQAIPVRFLEVILSQLKQGGFVESRRGKEGGYLLARDPARLPVGEVIRFVEGPLNPVDCVVGGGQKCPHYPDCAFLPLWQQVEAAMSEILDQTTFQQLIEQQQLRRERYVPQYMI